jgi:predicted Zn-dependent peptidase
MKRILILSFSTLLTAMTGLGQNIKFQEYDLKNGLHVILHEDHSTPIVAVTVLYHVGSKNEVPGKTGMAHFFEHLLFEGSDNIGRGEYAKYVENAGGGLNANTSQDRTFYYDLVPSNQLELGLWLESERMMHAKVEQVGIETQREVVKEEKRQRYDNQPYGQLFPQTLAHAYTKHPYAWAPIGSMEDLNAAKEQDFMDFYKTYYVPNNAVLSIAGDFNVDQAKKWIEAYFGEIPKGKDIVRPTIKEQENKGEVRDIIYGKDALPMVVQAYHIPAQGTPDFYAVDMLNTLLSNGESSRLNKNVVEDKELGLYCGAYTFNLEDPGLTLAFGLANMGIKAEELEGAMNAEFERLKTEPITDMEFQKLKNQIESDFISRNSTVAGIAESLANYYAYFGDTNLINTEINRYNAVSKEEMMSAARKYYNANNRVTLYFLQDPNMPKK